MTTVDLTAPRPEPAHLLDALPRRVALTLPELRHVAAAAGGAPLPCDVRRGGGGAGAEAGSMADRLGAAPGISDDEVLREVLAGLPAPATSLARRGLLVGGTVDPGLLGAVGLLATPSVALDLDVVVGDSRATAWHRRSAGAVATLATVDGIVFELAWLAVDAWAGELARVAVLPEDADRAPSAVPGTLDLPLELADAASEALATGRTDLLPQLVQQAEGPVVAEGAELDPARTADVLRALHAEARGRLRVLVAEVGGPGGPAETAVTGETLVVGVRSWVLLADGWRALRPSPDGAARVSLVAVSAGDLAADLAPLLAQVGAGGTAS